MMSRCHWSKEIAVGMDFREWSYLWKVKIENKKAEQLKENAFVWREHNHWGKLRLYGKERKVFLVWTLEYKKLILIS